LKASPLISEKITISSKSMEVWWVAVQHSRNIFKMYQKISIINIKLGLAGNKRALGIFLYLLYFIAILQWSTNHRSSASIDGGLWLELVVRPMMFSHIPPKLCASRWLWGVHVIFFLAGSILMRCGKFRFDFFVECVLFNHIFFALSLHLFLTIQFFPTALRWILFAATKSQECSETNNRDATIQH
jgi:hypothetical protein